MTKRYIIDVCKTRNVAQEKNILGKYALIMSRFKHLERVFAHKATVTESRHVQYTYFSRCSYRLLFSSNAYIWYWINYAHFVFVLRRDIASVHLIVILVAIRIDVYSVYGIIKRLDGSLFIGLKTSEGILSYDKIQYCCRCYRRYVTTLF